MSKLETKIPPVVVFTIAALLMWLVSKYTPAINLPEMMRWLIIFSFLLFGAVMGLFGVFSFLKEETTVNPMEPEKAKSLVDTGVLSAGFGIVRFRSLSEIVMVTAFCDSFYDI